MANPEHLKLLMQGVGVWNRWRKRSPGIKPDLSLAKLAGITPDYNLNLSEAELAGADLSDAKLVMANLTRANLFKADLCKADLSTATLAGASLSKAFLFGAKLTDA
ncbi:MAG TPA: pentapeptide repeat-containing protein, partial [Desulfobacterales bacterium]|nr:pentapeptide repeat-containing protein [Desulfobacterales bacterium]